MKINVVLIEQKILL